MSPELIIIIVLAFFAVAFIANLIIIVRTLFLLGGIAIRLLFAPIRLIFR